MCNLSSLPNPGLGYTYHTNILLLLYLCPFPYVSPFRSAPVSLFRRYTFGSSFRSVIQFRRQQNQNLNVRGLATLLCRYNKFGELETIKEYRRDRLIMFQDFGSTVERKKCCSFYDVCLQILNNENEFLSFMNIWTLVFP